MKIIVQLPTRERPDRFGTARLAMLNRATRPHDLRFNFVIDDDDNATERHIAHHVNLHNTHVSKGPRTSKIEACNRGLPGNEPWDIVVLASDDMLCQVKGWDDIIRQDMQREFPDTDGCLWYPDGHQTNLCTLAVMGRKAFDRDGYIYRPEYKSLWADNEWTETWGERGKLWRSDQQLFTHVHPGWGTAKMDRLYTFNNRFDKEDRDTYIRHKAQGFPA